MNEQYYIYGKLNQSEILKEYEGKETDTSKVIVDNTGNTISSEVKKVPHKLTILDKKNPLIDFEYDGSEDKTLNLSGYVNDNSLTDLKNFLRGKDFSYAKLISTSPSENKLEFYDNNKELISWLDFSNFTQVQADLKETNEELDSFVLNKSTKYLKNEGPLNGDGSIYAVESWVLIKINEVKSIIDNQEKEIEVNKTKIKEVESNASQINIVENADSTFTFTNYNGDIKTIQSGFLPDNDTLELKGNKLTLKQIHVDSSLEGKGTQEDPLLINIDNTTLIKNDEGKLEAISLKTDGESISGATIANELTELNKDVGDLTSQLNNDVDRLDAHNDTQDEEIKKLQDITQGIGGYLNSYDFGKDPTQDDLTNYALQQIGITDKNEIFDGTKVINLYDSHLWRLTNTPNSTPPVFEWSDLGEVQSVSIATEDTLGLVKSSTNNLKGSVNNLTGEISINNLKEYLADKASLTEQNDFSGINNFNAETNFNAEVNIHNHNLTINHGYVVTTDEDKDLVTKYSADEIVIENGTGADKNLYFLKLPNKNGTLATTDDVPEVDIDSQSITKNADNKLQATGIIFNNELITAEMIYNATHMIINEDSSPTVDPVFSAVTRGVCLTFNV